MKPKIADFGMVRIFGDNQQNANTRRVVGTYDYMTPEYAMEGIFSTKSDVYSFGVLLLEVVTGVRRSSTSDIMGFPNLIVYIHGTCGRKRGLRIWQTHQLWIVAYCMKFCSASM